MYWNLSGAVSTKVKEESTRLVMSDVCSIYFSAGMIVGGSNTTESKVNKRGTVLTEVLKEQNYLEDEALDESIIKAEFPEVEDIRTVKWAQANYEVTYKSLKIALSYQFLVKLDGVVAAENFCNDSINQFLVHLKTVL